MSCSRSFFCVSLMSSERLRYIQSISSLLQELVRLEKPIGVILANVDMSPMPRSLGHRNLGSRVRIFKLENMFVGELHRQKTLKLCCERFKRLIRLCQKFVKSTEVCTSSFRHPWSVPLKTFCQDLMNAACLTPTEEGMWLK